MSASLVAGSGHGRRYGTIRAMLKRRSERQGRQHIGYGVARRSLVLLAGVMLGPGIFTAPSQARSHWRCGGAAVAPATPREPAVPLQETAPALFRVNQVGYVVGCPKLALVMTQRPGLPRQFKVLAASGRVVYRGRASAPRRWNPRYVVCRLAFAPVNRPGIALLSFADYHSPHIRV